MVDAPGNPVLFSRRIASQIVRRGRFWERCMASPALGLAAGVADRKHPLLSRYRYARGSGWLDPVSEKEARALAPRSSNCQLHGPCREGNQAQARECKQDKAHRNRIHIRLPHAVQHPNAGEPCEIHERGIVTHQRERLQRHKDGGLLHQMGVVMRDPVGLARELRLGINASCAGRHASGGEPEKNNHGPAGKNGGGC